MLEVTKNNSGIIFSMKDTIATVSGMVSVTSGEMVEDYFGNLGVVLNLESSNTGVVMFSDNGVKSGDVVNRLHKTLNISVDNLMLGNVFDSVGSLLNKEDFLEFIGFNKFIQEFKNISRKVEVKAPGIIERQPVYEPLNSGVLGIDATLPLGQGQRELIIGDRQTGKTSIASDVVINQSNVNMFYKKNSVKYRDFSVIR